MGIYSNNPTVEDIVLTIISDGDGSQCGMTYKERCAAAETGLFKYLHACREYGRYRHRVYGSSIPKRAEISEAANTIQFYYRSRADEAARRRIASGRN